MSKPKFKCETVEIIEEVDGWRVRRSGVEDEIFSTAAEAQRAVSAHGAALAEGGVSSVQTTEWQPTTRIGHIVVRALT